MNNQELGLSKRNDSAVFAYLPGSHICEPEDVLCTAWLEMNSTLGGKHLPVTIRNSVSSRAKSYPNCLELRHFNRSPAQVPLQVKARASKTESTGGDFHDLRLWPDSPTCRQLQSTPKPRPESRFSERDGFRSPTSFKSQPWRPLTSYQMSSQLRNCHTSAFSQGLKSGTSVITFKLFQFEVRIINSWQSGLPDFFYSKIRK